MIVICINILYYGSTLTLNKKYKAIRIITVNFNYSYYEIIDDHNNIKFVEIKCFKLLKDYRKDKILKLVNII